MYIMHASEAERKLFTSHILDTKNYLEFGCGGSTCLVLQVTNANIVSIDSDKKFINYLNKRCFKKLQDKSRVRFIHIDIGKVKSWGRPKNNSKYDSWPKYSSLVFNVLDKKFIESIDTVFIDGRFRVACVLQTLMNCSKNYNS